MNRIKLLVLGSLLALTAMTLNAQSQSDMRLNEMLVTNVSDFQDDFGQHNGWFELFNISYGTVDIGGCYLTNDANNLKKYPIPKGDVLTYIKPRQHVLFWADNQPYRGTFHTNFTLAESDSIYFVASDGKTILDRIYVPKDLAAQTDKSFGRIMDGEGSLTGDGEGWGYMERTSPSTNNTIITGSKSMTMKEQDPYGIILTITAMSVVFLALLILCLIFKFTAHIAKKKLNKKSDEAMASKTSSTGKSADKAAETSSETYAAIGMALHLLYMESESHDDESYTITMCRPDKAYSPWSSKIYNLREVPTLQKNKR